MRAVSGRIEIVHAQVEVDAVDVLQSRRQERKSKTEESYRGERQEDAVSIEGEEAAGAVLTTL